MNDSRFKLPDEAVQLASGRLLIAGGSKEVEVFDPANGKFLVAAGQMSEPWHFLSETKLSDGSVLLAGGYPTTTPSHSPDLDLPSLSLPQELVSG